MAAATASALDRDHTLRLTDARPLAELFAAAYQGMGAVINRTVVRPDPVRAFRVNTLGAYNVMRGAVAAGIRRVVHTDPQ